MNAEGSMATLRDLTAAKGGDAQRAALKKLEAMLAVAKRRKEPSAADQAAFEKSFKALEHELTGCKH